ncbi:MAG: bifunctional serine/threonine-protein kinase/formylglycine-generating enzyme family protein [Planctomycetota bacterium]
MAGDVIGPYRLVHELGAGRSGIVYLAERVDSHGLTAGRPERIALKVLRPQRLAGRRGIARFLRTAELASRLDAPNVCPVKGGGTHQGLPWLALRYLEGNTLAEHITTRSPSGTVERRDVDRVLVQGEKLARALHRLHQNGITHRDVKPNNILIDRDGEPWLLDFGLMRVDGVDDGDEPTAGSPAYMAPELLRQVSSGNPASDLFALGATLFEALTGRLPYTAPTVAGLVLAMEREARPRARQVERSVPAPLDAVLDRLLAPRPRDRYRHAGEAADDLARVRQGLPLAPQPLARARRILRWVRRNPVVTACLSVLLLTLPVLLGLFQRQSEARDRTELLASRAELAAARRTAESMLPARVVDRAALRDWLQRLRGPRGLAERLPRLRAAYAEMLLVSTTNAAPATTRESLEAELRAFEQLPLVLAGIAGRGGVGRMISSLEPAIERHRLQLEAKLDAKEEPVPSWGDSEQGRLAGELRANILDLEAALRPGGLVHRVEVELVALDRIAPLEARLASAWSDAVGTVASAEVYAADVGRGFRLVAQEGLAPLGADPASGLQEFALLRSGEWPLRDAAGRLQVRVEDAVVFVLMPGGSFAMGATSVPGMPNAEGTSLPDESPVTTVDLAPYLLSKYEITQAQWRRLGGSPSPILRAGDKVGATTITELHPVEVLSFREAEQVLAGNGLVLPTEAQWEYAARRSGLAEPFGTNVNLREEDDGYPASHAPVGSYPPDRSGLHDLIGNVFEMVADEYGNYDLSIPRAGDGRRSGWRPERMMRGGSFASESSEARPARRSAVPDFGALPFLGVRPVFPLSQS